MRYIKSFENDAAIQAAVDNKSLGKPYVALNEQTGEIDWNEKDIDYSNMYFTIDALSGGTFYVRNANIGYSVNGADWETTTGVTELSLNQGDKVRFKGTDGGNKLFSGNTLTFNAYGNIESLEYGDDFIGKTAIKTHSNAFYGIFVDSSGILDASNLILPATSFTSTSNCYGAMFQNCTNITRGPILHAETIEKKCYYYMFSSCSNLNYIKCLASTFIASGVIGPTFGWTNFVSPTGTFVKKAGVEWETGASGIPSGWTVIEE